MKINTKLFYFALCSAAAYIVGYKFTGNTLPALAAQVPPKPLVVRQNVVTFDESGGARLTEDRTTAIRADGAESRIVLRPHDPDTPPNVLLIRPDGSATAGFGALGAKMSGFLTKRKIDSMRMRSLAFVGNCRFANETGVFDDELLGVKVHILRQQVEDTRTTTWRAPDYQCMDLKLETESLVNGQWKAKFTVVPVSFVPGDPPTALFDEKQLDLLREMKPSEARALANEKLNVTPKSCPKCFDLRAAENMDKLYFEHQVKR